MATTKATLVASQISIEAALAKLEREVENADGAHKEALARCVAAIHDALRKRRGHILH